MPGHPIAEKEEGELLDSVHQLRDLIENHDVIFLLTDSRESRWLPTLLCAAQDKLLINAALGFDSFLVLRHGGFADSVKSLRNRAACYFCSDVVAPTDVSFFVFFCDLNQFSFMSISLCVIGVWINNVL